MIPKIELIDENHLRINGYLVDMVAIRYWFESQTWPAHSPEANFRGLCIACSAMNTDPQNGEAVRAIASRIQWNLAALTTYGSSHNKLLYVPDDPFVHSCASPFVRGPASDCVMTAMMWQSNRFRQISKTWWRVRAGAGGSWTDEYAFPFLDPEWIHPWGSAYT